MVKLTRREVLVRLSCFSLGLIPTTRSFRFLEIMKENRVAMAKPTSSAEKHELAKEIFGYKIITIQSECPRLDRREAEWLKKRYTELVQASILALRSRGAKEPKNENELGDILAQISALIWSKFRHPSLQIASNIMFIDDFKGGVLDCDTSAILFKDILSGFNVRSRPVLFNKRLVKLINTPENHVMLKIYGKPGAYGEKYIETTGHLWDASHILEGAVTDISGAKKRWGSDTIIEYSDIMIVQEAYIDMATNSIESVKGAANTEGIRNGIAFLKIALKIGEEGKNNKLDDRIYHVLGVAKFYNLEFADAVDYLKKSIKISKDKTIRMLSYNVLGNVYFQMGREKQAIECYDRALSINPDYAKPHISKGRALIWLDQDEKASKEFDMAIKIGYDKNKLRAMVDEFKMNRKKAKNQKN